MDETLVRIVIGYATRKATAAGEGVTALSVLETALDALAGAEIVNGKAVISTSEAGGTVTFAQNQGLNVADTARLLQRAIDRLSGKNVAAHGTFSFRNASTS